MSVTYDHTKLTPEENAVIDAILRKNNAIVEPEKANKVWEPKAGEKFYSIIGTGEVTTCTCYKCDDYRERHSIGNCFRTKEEAEFAVERLKVIAELRRFAEEHDEPILWSSDSSVMKYSIIYDHYCDWVVAKCTHTMQEATIYFSSLEIANAAIEAIGEDRLKKYYFCL